ncbi:hypothetical protein JZ751_005466, partial [Albula glossodonta]
SHSPARVRAPRALIAAPVSLGPYTSGDSNESLALALPIHHHEAGLGLGSATGTPELQDHMDVNTLCDSSDTKDEGLPSHSTLNQDSQTQLAGHTQRRGPASDPKNTSARPALHQPAASESVIGRRRSQEWSPINSARRRPGKPCFYEQDWTRWAQRSWAGTAPGPWVMRRTGRLRRADVCFGTRHSSELPITEVIYRLSGAEEGGELTCSPYSTDSKCGEDGREGGRSSGGGPPARGGQDERRAAEGNSQAGPDDTLHHRPSGTKSDTLS